MAYSTKITALYEPLSRDDELQGPSNPMEPLIKTQEKQGYSQKRGETSETDPYFG